MSIKRVEVKIEPRVRTVELYGGLPGRKGDTGNPGIYVGDTPPPDPQENDLWLDTSD